MRAGCILCILLGQLSLDRYARWPSTEHATCSKLHTKGGPLFGLGGMTQESVCWNCPSQCIVHSCVRVLAFTPCMHPCRNLSAQHML